MKKIILLTTDGVVWKREEFLIDLSVAMSSNEAILIDTNTEGPDLSTLGVYNWINRIADQTNYNLKNLTIRTGNVYESHPTINLIKSFPWMYLNWGKENAISLCDNKVFDHNFKTFASFISRGNWHRLTVGTYLYHNHRSRSLQSYHYDNSNDYHNSNLGITEFIIHNNVDRLGWVKELLEKCPITLDSVYTYPILNPHGYGLTDHYKHFFVEIVTETYSQGNTFFPTEKIWRPITQMTPFIVQGSQHYLARLKKLGFKTFDQWWDEGYSEDPYDYQTKLIEEVIDKLSVLSVDQLQVMYEDMLPTLEHNRNRLLEITKEDLKVLNA